VDPAIVSAFPRRPIGNDETIGPVLPWFEPMLAVSRPARVPDAAWAFEPKLDGWRALV